MDKKAVETMAVSAIQRQIALCDFLSPSINQQDKEPCWDGFLYIFGNKEKTKGPDINRIAVQVKGTEQVDLSKDEISARVDIVDLRSYLNVHGTMYFVVYINGLESRIYYVDFTPVRIKEILERAKESQQTIGVKLSAFPNDKKEIENIVINFADHCKRQASFSDIKLISMDELSHRDDNFKLSLFYSGHQTGDPFGAMLEHGMYLYLESDTFPIPQPIGTIPKDMEFSEVIPASISIGGKEHYNSYRRIRTKECTKIVLGKCFTLTMNNKNKDKTTINYKSSNYLKIIAQDLAFMIDCIDNSGFMLDGIRFDFAAKEEELIKFDVNKVRERLEFAQKAIKALDVLNYTGDINLSSLSKQHHKNLQYLITAFVDELPVDGLLPNLPFIIAVDLAEYKFALVLIPYNDEPGKYLVKDYFNKELEVHSKDKDGQEYRTSQYVILTHNDLLTLTNLRLKKILHSFQVLSPHPSLFTQANNLLLEILIAYDKENERVELLNLALEFAYWLMDSVSDDVLPIEVRLLNIYQIKLRTQDLSQEEKEILDEMIIKSADFPNILTGANLLLGRQADAEKAFARMSEEQQCDFQKYPIFRFWIK